MKKQRLNFAGVVVVAGIFIGFDVYRTYGGEAIIVAQLVLLALVALAIVVALGASLFSVRSEDGLLASERERAWLTREGLDERSYRAGQAAGRKRGVAEGLAAGKADGYRSGEAEGYSYGYNSGMMAGRRSTGAGW